MQNIGTKLITGFSDLKYEERLERLRNKKTKMFKIFKVMMITAAIHF